MPRAKEIPTNDTLTADLAFHVGMPKAGVSHWGIEKAQGEGSWGTLRYSDGKGVSPNMWLLSELSIDLVRQRWGQGIYRCRWYGSDPAQPTKMIPMGTGKHFKLDEIQAPPPPPPQEPPNPFAQFQQNEPFPGFAAMMAMMGVVNQQSTMQIQSVTKMAEAFGSGSRNDNNMPMFALMLDNQNKTMAALMQQNQQQHAATLATIMQALGTDDEEEEDDRAEGIVRAAAPLFKPGKPLMPAVVSAIGNYLAENPKTIGEIITAAPAVMQQFQTVIAQQQAQQQAPTPPPTPPPTSQTRPRAQRSEQQPAPQGPGLNSMFSEPPKAVDGNA